MTEQLLAEIHILREKIRSLELELEGYKRCAKCKHHTQHCDTWCDHGECFEAKK